MATDPYPRKANAIDWEAVEREYRAGVASQREIAEKYGVSHTAIQKRAKRDDWQRDLQAKIKAKADALVAKAEVATQVATETAATERELVEANATAIMRVRLTHRTDIARARDLAMKLLGELEQTAEAIPLIERLEALVAMDASDDPISVAKRADALRKVLELPTRTGTMKMLAETMTKLVTLERQAYSLDTEKDKTPEGEGFEAFRAMMGRIDGAGTGLA